MSISSQFALRRAHETASKRQSRLHSIWHYVRDEIRKTRPVFLFFLSGFLLVLLIVKLSLAQYSITVSVMSRALLGALLAAKVVLILESTPLARPFGHLARIYDIILKSLAYGAGVILLGVLERVAESERHAASFSAGLQHAMASVNMHRLLAVTLGITAVFALYFTFAEINRRMGEGALKDFLINRPAG